MDEVSKKDKTTNIGGIDAVVHGKAKKKKEVKKASSMVIVVKEEQPETLVDSLYKRRGSKPIVKEHVAWHAFLIGLIAGIVFPIFYVIFAEIEVTAIQQKLPEEVEKELTYLFAGENFWSFLLASIIPFTIYSFLVSLTIYYLILSKKRLAFLGMFMMIAGPVVMLIIGLYTLTH